MAFDPQGLATAIGSMPHTNPSNACDIILNAIPEIPIWPQLPNTNFREEMETQYNEGIPCVVLDKGKKLTEKWVWVGWMKIKGISS